jgi:hypothetical protein
MIDLNAHLSYQTKPYDNLGTHKIFALSDEGLNHYQYDKEHITYKYLSKFHPKIMKYVNESCMDSEQRTFNNQQNKNINIKTIPKNLLFKNPSKVIRKEIYNNEQNTFQNLPQINQTVTNLSKSHITSNISYKKPNSNLSTKNNIFQNYNNNKLSNKNFYFNYSNYKDPSLLNSLIYSKEYPFTKNTKLLNTIAYGSSSLTNNSSVDLDKIVYQENERLKNIILKQSNLSLNKKKELIINTSDEYYSKYVPQIGKLKHSHLSYTKSPDFFGYYHQ